MAQNGMLRPGIISSLTLELMERFDIRAANSHTLAGQLSGGNLQKLVLARELSRDPLLILVMNPTAGLT